MPEMNHPDDVIAIFISWADAFELSVSTHARARTHPRMHAEGNRENLYVLTL